VLNVRPPSPPTAIAHSRKYDLAETMRERTVSNEHRVICPISSSEQPIWYASDSVARCSIGKRSIDLINSSHNAPASDWPGTELVV